MPQGKSRKQCDKGLGAITKEEWETLYLASKLTQCGIAAMLGVTQGAVVYHLRKHGIPIRSHRDELVKANKVRRGVKNPRWNGGRTKNKQGYILVLYPGHPKADHKGYVREHVLVWEKANGMLVPDGWHVHHKNGVKDDNRPENLEAMTHAKHSKVIPDLLRRIAELETKLRQCAANTKDGAN